MTEADLVKIFKDVGLYAPFHCEKCRRNDYFVSGPHSHVCSKCGNEAVYGFYTVPYCAKCKAIYG
jgi:hypothetical protein